MIYERHTSFGIERSRRSKRYTMHEPHYHDSYEIFVPHYGTSTLMIGDEVFSVEPDCVAVIKELSPHGNFSKAEHERTVLYFDKDFLSPYLTVKAQALYLSLFENRLLKPSSDDFKKIQTLCSLLQKEHLSSNNPDKIFPLLSELLLILKASPIVKAPPIYEADSVFGAVLSYININYKSITSIPLLAENFFVSPSYLCRIFKKGTHLTISQYINSLKINEACEMLKTTDKSLMQISLEVGYNSYPHFVNNFTRITALSPNEYRKKNREQSVSDTL
ncbi:MAG: helix-turn-helix domain-containing protein [Clostridia bacterium]|nr:helix-turn-helix domain-containing protein [Clostridia bacterium]